MLNLVALYALLAAIVHSVFSLANKFLMARGSLRALPATLVMQSCTGVIALGFILGGRVPLVPAAMPYVLAVAVVSSVGFVLIMAAMGREDASAVGPILGLKVIYLALLEPLMGGAAITPVLAGAALLSMAGVALVSQTDTWSLHPRDLLRPGVAMMAGAALCFAICDLCMKEALRRWESWPANLYVVLAMAVVSLLALGVLRLAKAEGTVRWTAVRPVLGWIALSSVTIFLTQYFFFTAITQANVLEAAQRISAGYAVTLVNILYNVRSLFVLVLAALLVLGGRSTIERAGPRAYLYRTAGTLLTLGAIVLAMVAK
jgi:drug/metabolite transporter (DMT)-like permease